MTVFFCHECNNMLYPKEDKLRKLLLYSCRNCFYSIKASDPCIYESKPGHHRELDQINSDLIGDPALSRTSRESPVECPNKECDSIEAVYMQTASNDPRSKMNLFYICCKCRQKWTYENQEWNFGSSFREIMEESVIRASPRRWAIIFIFAAYSLTSAFQWIEFAIVPAVFQEYYGIEYSQITCTSQIYMATFIPLIFPATWLIEQTGLRNIALLGSFINMLGSGIKCLGTGQDSWWIVFIGQTFSACAQCFILELPPKIASIWFPANEISTATSIGVFGNQLGVALGFLIPPKIITGPREAYADFNATTYPEDWSNSKHGNETAAAAIDEVKGQIFFLYALFGAICAGLFVLVLIVFKDKPKTPANRASIKRSVTEKTSSTSELEEESSAGAYVKSIKNLLKDIPFLLLIVSYGLNVGCYYAISTLLVPIIKPTFFDTEDNKQHSDDFLLKLDEQIGAMGTIMVVAGLAGSLIGGILLDKFKKYKLTTLVTYIFSLVFMVLFTYMVDFENLQLDFFFIGALGFFMTGYLPIGFEFGAEITYPESEASSSGLLNCAAQVFGLLVTGGCERIITYFTVEGDKMSEIRGGYYANITMVACLIVGTILTALIKEDLKRQRAENDSDQDTRNPLLSQSA